MFLQAVPRLVILRHLLQLAAHLLVLRLLVLLVSNQNFTYSWLIQLYFLCCHRKMYCIETHSDCFL
jgi:hypothetical protein